MILSENVECQALPILDLSLRQTVLKNRTLSEFFVQGGRIASRVSHIEIATPTYQIRESNVRRKLAYIEKLARLFEYTSVLNVELTWKTFASG